MRQYHLGDYTTRVYKNPHSLLAEDHTLLHLPNKVVIVTSPSIHKEKAVIAWIVTNNTGQIIKTSQHFLEETHILLFRAEALGVYSALNALHIPLQQQGTKWRLYCDNKALIYRLNASKTSPVNIKWTDSDALLAIRKITPENGQFHHSKGHTVLSDRSSLPEKLNHIVDRKANKAMNDPPHSIQFNGVIKIVGNGSQLFSVRDVVQYCGMTVSKLYWQTRLGHATFDLIDWEVYQQICSAQKQYNSIKKTLAGITPTKQRLHKLDTVVLPLCPLCNDAEETIHHIITCPNNPDTLQNLRESIVKITNKYMKTQSATNRIIDNIVQKDNTVDHILLQNQDAVSWEQLIQGKFTLTLHDYIQPSLKNSSKTQKVLITLGIELTSRWRKAWINRLQQVGISNNRIISTQQRHHN